jgi:hypothetical protein
VPAVRERLKPLGLPRIRHRDGAPVAWFVADQCGTFVDICDTHYVATNHGGLTRTASPRGPAIKGDGSTGYAEVPNFFLGGFALTISIWVNEPSTTNGNSLYVCKEPTNSDWLIMLEGNIVKLRAASTTSIDWSPTLGFYDLWHNLVGTIQSDQTSLIYYDGAVVASGFTGFLANTIDLLHIGEFGTFGPGYRINGAIDDIRIYNRVLSPQEIRRDFEDPWWRLRRPRRAAISLASAPPIFVGSSSGGVSLGGSAIPTVTFGRVGSGGITIGGSASPAANFGGQSSGGVLIGGSASPGGQSNMTGSGGVTIGGSATPSASFAAASSGGVLIGGTAVPSILFGQIGSGGIRVGGSARSSVIFVGLSSGGIILGGVAVVGFESNPGGGPFNATAFGRRRFRSSIERLKPIAPPQLRHRQGAPKAWWIADRAGTLLDATDGRRRPTQHGGLSRSAGPYGPALTFNGSTGWASVPDPLGPSGVGTLSVLANYTGGTNTRAFSGWDNNYSLAINSNGFWIATVFDGLANRTVVGPLATAGQWTRLAMAWTSTTLTLYAGGSLAGTASLSGAPPSVPVGGTASIAATAAGTGQFFLGALDDVRFYDYVLTPAQLAFEAMHPWWRLRRDRPLACGRRATVRIPWFLFFPTAIGG